MADLNEHELELLSNLVGLYLETDDLNQREWGEAKVLQEKIDHRLDMITGALDPHEKFFHGG